MRNPNSDWWRGATIYQIYPRSFFDSNRDGIGDLAGIIDKLSYVARLGVDAIWLGPVCVSPQKDFGYDVAGYTEIDPIFGTLDDFDRLIAAAHRLDLKVLVDQVWSHTSDEHPWFQCSRQHQTNPHADWYVWADPAADGMPPNNWLSVFGGSAWTWDPRRRQFYMHHFLASQPALNLHNPAVVDALIDVGQFWLDRGIDGFRLDAIDFLTHHPALPNNPSAAPWGGITPIKPFALQHHVNDMLHESRHEVLARIRSLLNSYPGTVALGEVSSQPGAFQRVIDYTSGDHCLHMAYTMSVLRKGFTWEHITSMLHDLHVAGDTGWPCWSFSNHDVERSVSRWNPYLDRPPPSDFVRLLAMLLLCLRGTLCIYQGEELGLTDATLTFEQLRDPFGIAYWPAFRGRDGSRTPMPWRHDAQHGGFTQADQGWLSIPTDHYSMAVSRQEDDPSSILAFWRHLLDYRQRHVALRLGALTPLDLAEPLVGFVRDHPDEQLICVFNLSNHAATMDIPGIDTQTLAPFGFLVQVPEQQFIFSADGALG